MRDKPIEELIPSWFDGTLNTKEREKVEKWKEASEENRQIFADSQRAWEGIEQLKLMEKYDSQKALLQVHSRIKSKKDYSVLAIFQKVAAVLILPLMAVSFWLILDSHPSKPVQDAVLWHTLEIPAGMRSEYYLPDSTKVYLNSKTRLSYPITFSNELREVKLSGEAYFEVAENKNAPFIVNTGRINIEVTGTEFLATTYAHENLTEIILINGSVNLYQGDYQLSRKDIAKLHPGERAFCMAGNNKLVIEKVHTGKYSAWKEGLLIFRDDPMPEVVRRLNRWFNVDIKLEGPELNDWSYTATFEDETLEQVLELLKISAPIDYTIKRRELKTDKTFSKMEIIIKQKRQR